MLYEELLKNKKVLPGITDTVFKKIMIHHKDYLGLILENIIPIKKEEIEEKGKFLNIEIPSSHLSMKNERMDLLLKVDNYYINLEANTSTKIPLIIRNEAHFAGMVFNEYARKDKKTLEEILYQVAFYKTKRLSNKLKVNLKWWDEDLKLGEKNIQKVEINLEFVNNKYYNKEKLSRYEKALLLLILENEEEIIELIKGDEILENVGNDIISYARAKEIVTAYEYAMIEENCRNNLAREEGYDRGHEEGIKDGIEQGIGQKQIDVAQNMLQDDMPIDKISKYTGLTESEILSLKNNC